MKKYIILYAVFAIALGIALGALGIYLMRIDLAEKLGIAYIILLFGPVLWLKIFFTTCMLYGVLLVASGIIALISFFNNSFINLKKNLRTFLRLNSLMLIIVFIVDIVVFDSAVESIMSGTPSPLAICISLINPLSVAFQVIAVIADKKLK